MALRDGRVALIAPLHPDDRERYLGLRQASPESLYKRFMTPIARLTESQLRYLLEIDHRDHEALLAIDEASGDAVAVGRFVRLERDSQVAEAALLVIDDWQGLGLGKAICRVLADRARELGIARFEASMLAENEPMLALLRSLGELEPQGEQGGVVTVEVELPDPGIGEHETGVLRAVGQGAFELAEPPVGGDEAG